MHASKENVVDFVLSTTSYSCWVPESTVEAGTEGSNNVWSWCPKTRSAGIRTLLLELNLTAGLALGGRAGAKDDVEESGWKMVAGDVFRAPKDAMLLCVQLGSGVQIILSAFITLFFAALGARAPPAELLLFCSLPQHHLRPCQKLQQCGSLCIPVRTSAGVGTCLMT